MGDSWTILQAGADITSDLATIDNFIANGGYAPITHDTPVAPGNLLGTFAATDLSAPLPNGLTWELDYTGTDVILSVGGMAQLTCDFDSSGGCDINDIDALVMEIAAGGNDLSFDLTGDGMVDGADLNEWRSVAGEANLGEGRAYLAGDANLDAVVDGQDFVVWNGSKFTATGKWSEGDFNADGNTDGQDFIVWNSSKFQSADVTTVPEPSGLLSLLLGLAFLYHQSWRRA